MTKDINPEIHTTKIVNVDDKPFDIYANGQLARHLEPGEEAIVPIFVAQLGAKHLIDRILQEKHNISNTLSDTPLRRDYFKRIVPELQEEVKEELLTDEEFKKQVQEQLDKQAVINKELSGESKEKEDKMSKEIKELKEKIAKLESPPKPKGRPKKVT